MAKRPAEPEVKRVAKWEAERFYDSCTASETLYDEKTSKLLWRGTFRINRTTTIYEVEQTVPPGGSYTHRGKGAPDVWASGEPEKWGMV